MNAKNETTKELSQYIESCNKNFGTYLLFVGKKHEKYSFDTIKEVKSFLVELGPCDYFIYKNFTSKDLWDKNHEAEEEFFRANPDFMR